MADGNDTHFVLVSGSREWNDWATLEAEFARIYQEHGQNVVLTHGNARGLDRMAGYVAEKKRWSIRPMPADWDRYGKTAGRIRNVEMLDTDPDEVIAFRLDMSRGTTHLINIAREAGYAVKVIDRFTPPEEPEGKDKDMATNEEIAAITAAVVAALQTKADTPLTESSEELYDPTAKDVEGNPLKVKGQGVRPISHMAAKGCGRCGSGGVSWVLSRKTYGAGHPKEGQQIPYLAQAYGTSEGKLVALAWQRHSDYCQADGTKVPQPEQLSTDTVEETDKEGESIDDKLEADRAPAGTFDAFAHAESNELGSDVGMGFLIYSDLNNMAEAESESD